MPPKASRGKSGKGTVNDDNKNAATSSTSSNPTNPPDIAPPQQNEAGPNASPASNDTSLPAPTRLESLRTASPAVTSPRGGRKGPIAKPKFVGRRSQAARAELEREEAAKKAAEEAEAAQNARKQKRFSQGYGGDRGAQGRGRGGRGRGRGGFMEDHQRLHVASGPFSAGQASQDIRSGYTKHSGWGGGSGSSGVFGGGGGPQSRSWGNGTSKPSAAGGIKTEGGNDIFANGSGRMRSVKAEDGGYISSDDEELDGGMLQKQNIDELQSHIVDLTGAQHGSTGNAFAPVRLPRVPVRDRKVGLSAEEASKRSTEDNTASESSNQIADTKKAKAGVRDVEITRSVERPRRATAYSSSSDTEDKPKIKKEPTEDDADLSSVETSALTTIPDQNVLKDPPSSPESKRKAKEIMRSAVDDAKPADFTFERPKTPSYPTQHEVDEFHRKWDDRATVFAELGRVAMKKRASGAATDGEGDVDMTDVTPEKSVRDDQVYLFQFPPILPNLHPAGAKPEPKAPEDGDTHEAMEVDREDKKDSKQAAKTRAEGGQALDVQTHLAPGLVGKLRIHKSGRAYLDWGGKNTLKLELGMPAIMLQNVMLAKVPDAKTDAESTQSSDDVARAMGLGAVKQKFVMTPRFD